MKLFDKSQKSGGAPKVFFLRWKDLEKLDRLIDRSHAMDIVERGDIVAVKMHFGEIAEDGHIRPELVRPFLKALSKKKARPFLTDTNTIYHGPRNNALDHLRVAADHGFSQTRLQVPVIISDGIAGDDHDEVSIQGKYLKAVKIATGIRRADKLIALSHFKGHLLTGLGGAIKNLGMGCASKAGKFEMHSSAGPTVNAKVCVGCEMCIAKCAHGALSIAGGKISFDKSLCAGCGECVIACHTNALSITWNEGSASVQEKLAEYALGATKGKGVFYFNFLNHITPNCDCMGMKEKPLVDDIGVLASGDPVAIDQASLDLVIKFGGDVFKAAHPQLDGTLQISHAEDLGLGTRKYELVEI